MPQSISPISWSHKFICLDKMDADRIPTTKSAKMALEEAGLGEKVMKEPDMDLGLEEFNTVVLSAYPKLKEGGDMKCCNASRPQGTWSSLGPESPTPQNS